jgi:hypothetical protein
MGKSIVTCLICVFSLFELVAQYRLDSLQFEKLNKVWVKKAKVVEIQTIDSTVHIGQIIFVSDSFLLLYADSGFIDPGQTLSYAHSFDISEINSIYVQKSRKKVSRTFRSTVIGSFIGGACGTLLHFVTPQRAFQPIFIVPAVGAGSLVGMATGKDSRRYITTDTVWIYQSNNTTDSTVTEKANSIIASTYKITVWQDTLPESILWQNGTLVLDSNIAFDDIAVESRMIKRTFPTANFHVGVYLKQTFNGYNRVVTLPNSYLLNIGYRFYKAWELDAYFNRFESQVNIHPTLGTASLSGYAGALTCSYFLINNDRFNVKPFQLSLGIGLVHNGILFTGNFPAHYQFSRQKFGILGKMQGAYFFNRRIALSIEIHQTYFSEIHLQGFDWLQTYGTVTIPDYVVKPSYFLAAIGLRVNL